MSVHHWGENPSGQWTLTVNFKSSSGYVSMTDLQMTLYGTTQTPQAVANIPSVCDLGVALVPGQVTVIHAKIFVLPPPCNV